MFVANFKLKTFVQKLLVDLFHIMDFSNLHPARELQKIALAESVDYIQKHMPNAIALETAREVLETALSEVNIEGQFCEFGVYKGGTITFISNHIGQKTVHGFDSFEGLPEKWSGGGGGAANIRKGAFSMAGKLPNVPKNVVLHKGLFEETLPKWLAENPGPMAFIHNDCDLYSATKTVLQLLKPRMISGTIIVFDEYFNYPNWQQHEFKAFKEFTEECQVKYEYLAFARLQVAVKILDIRAD